MKPRIVIALVLALFLGPPPANAVTVGSLSVTSSVPTTAEMNAAIDAAPFVTTAQLAGSNYIDTATATSIAESVVSGSAISDFSTSGGSAGQVFMANGAGAGSWVDQSSPTSGITQAAADLRYGPIADVTANTASLNQAFINAKDYGALGNDSANDTAALQAAIDASEAAKVPLYIPAGTYRTYATLTNSILYTGTIVYGAGEGATIIKPMVDGIDGWYVDSTDDGYEGFVFKDITISRAYGSSETGIGLRIEGGNGTIARVRIEGCQFNFFEIGLLLNECDQSSVTATRFGANATGCKVDGNSNAINFLNCIVNDSSVVGYEIAQGTGANFIGCDMGNSNHATPILNLHNATTFIQGCNFEMHKDAPAIVSTNDCHITVDSCAFANIAVAGQDPTWNFPAVLLAPNPSDANKYPLLTFRNNYVGGATTQPAVRRWSDNIQVFGSPYGTSLTATAANGFMVELVNGTYPTVGAVLDRRHIGPFPHSWDSMNTTIDQVGQIYWKTSTGSAADDLRVTYPTSASTYSQTSLLNDKMYSTVGTWTADQNFSTADADTLTTGGGTVAGYESTGNGTFYRSQVWASCGVDSTSIVVYAKNDIFSGTTGDYFAYMDTDVADEVNSFVGRKLATGSFSAPNDTSAQPASSPTTVNGVVNWQTAFGGAVTVYWAHLEMASLSRHSQDPKFQASTPWSFTTQTEANAGGFAGLPLIADAEGTPPTTIFEVWALASNGTDASFSTAILRPKSGSGIIRSHNWGGQGGGLYNGFLMYGSFADEKRVILPQNSYATPVTGTGTIKQMEGLVKFISGKTASTVYLTNP